MNKFLEEKEVGGMVEPVQGEHSLVVLAEEEEHKVRFWEKEGGAGVEKWREATADKCTASMSTVLALCTS